MIKEIRKVRKDKGEDRLNTTTKYALYSVGAFVAGYVLSYSLSPRYVENTKYVIIPQDIYVDRIVEKIKYEVIPCEEPVTKSNS